MRRRQYGWATIAAFAVLLTSDRSSAFCWGTTCNDDDLLKCPRDENGCLETGQRLFWPEGALTVWSGAEGSTDDGISGDQLEKAVRKAFRAWTDVRCADGLHPGISVTFAGQLENGHADVDEAPHAENQNVVSFVDEHTPYTNGWPYRDNVVGLTTVTFDAKTGRILDTDTELNSAQHCFINTETGVDMGQCTGQSDPKALDLLAVVTHEAGHQFGLDHSKVVDATMGTFAPGCPDDCHYEENRTLERDDKLGICTIYPSSFEEDVAGGGIACRIRPRKSNGDPCVATLALVAITCIRRRKRIQNER